MIVHWLEIRKKYAFIYNLSELTAKRFWAKMPVEGNSKIRSLRLKVVHKFVELNLEDKFRLKEFTIIDIYQVNKIYFNYSQNPRG